jgi:hypothetical protein
VLRSAHFAGDGALVVAKAVHHAEHPAPEDPAPEYTDSVLHRDHQCNISAGEPKNHAEHPAPEDPAPEYTDSVSHRDHQRNISAGEPKNRAERIRPRR